jgi:hypothetical protein
MLPTEKEKTIVKYTNQSNMKNIIEKYYHVDEEKYKEYVSSLGDVVKQNPNQSGMTFFPPYDFKFEELENLKNRGIIVFNGVDSLTKFEGIDLFNASNLRPMEFTGAPK